MSRALWAVLFWLVSASDLWAIDFTRYHSQEEINSYLKEVATAHPELAHFHLLGYSQRGREVNYLVLSKGDADALPAIYLNGTHHGNEKSSTEAALGLKYRIARGEQTLAGPMYYLRDGLGLPALAWIYALIAGVACLLTTPFTQPNSIAVVLDSQLKQIDVSLGDIAVGTAVEE